MQAELVYFRWLHYNEKARQLALPPEVAALSHEFQSTEAVRWARDMYRRHRAGPGAPGAAGL